MSGRTYAIADLHGRFDLLGAALDRIEAHAENGKVIFLGDYVDRGPESRQIIERLMAGAPPGWRWTCLQGNHEAMMLETLRKPLHPDWWVGNGGGQTLLSYGHEDGGAYKPSVVPKAHLDWIARLPLLYADEHRVFVHAGVSESYPLDEQPEQVLQWFRYPNGADVGYRGRHVVHGHEQFDDGPILLPKRTDLDTFAWYTGRIVVGVFDDAQPGGPVEVLEVVRSPVEMEWAD